MSEESGVGRRRVLQLSGGLLGSGLVASTASTTRSNGADNVAGSLPGVTDVTFLEVEDNGLVVGETDASGGETVIPVASIGSGAFVATGGDQPGFYGVADGGPGIDCENAESVIGRSPSYFCGDETGSIRPFPDYAPTIYRMALDEDETFRLESKRPLTDAAGEEITTLTNPISNGTTPMYSIEGESIPFDPNGLDIEGIARTAGGTFWLGEEYAPSLAKVAPDGEVLARYVPETIDADLSGATYPVNGVLPEVFKRRDRGIESVGLSPDDSAVYFALQSPLANPDSAAFESSPNLRLGTFDPEAEEVSAQYLYRLDRPETFQKDATAGKVTQSDVKVSEISVVGEDRLLVLERISQTTKFYVVDLSDAAPIPASYDNLSARPTLAQVDPSMDDDLDPVSKQLLFTTDDYEGFPPKLEAIAQLHPDELLILNDSDYELFGGETVVARVQLDGPLGGGPQSGFVTNEATQSGLDAPLALEPLGRYNSGVFDEGAAEIVGHDPATQRVFVVNADAGAVDVLDVSDPADPTKLTTIETTDAFGAAGSTNSLDINNGRVAVAVANENPQADGRVTFYDTKSLELLGVATVGALPDLVTFTPDGQYVLTADEGEPSGYEDGDINPEGSISIVDLSGGVANATVETAGFGAFNDRRAELIEAGVRIYGPDATVAEDLEPEYITVDADSMTAWATLQENNALAVIDIEAAEITDILPLGYKDFSQQGNGLDAIDDGEVGITTQPLFGMYQPDGIASFAAGGQTFLVTANEGDNREAEDFPGFTEVTTIGDLREAGELSDPDAVPTDLNEVEVTTHPPYADGAPDSYEDLYAFGGRSFAIWTDDGELVYESGNTFEQVTAEAYPANFNADDNENDIDSESPGSGPEPEGVALGRIAGRQYAFVGIEKIGGIMIFDVTAPQERDPTLVQYINTRDFSVDPEAAIEEGDAPAEAAGDLAPEGLVFVGMDESPVDDPLLVVGYEVSGTTTLYRIAGSGTTTETEEATEGDELGQNDEDDDGDGAIDEDGEDGDDEPSNDDDDGDGAIDEDDEPDDGDDGSDDYGGEAEDDDDGDGAFDEDGEPDGGNSDDVDNDGDGHVDEDDEPDNDD